LLAGVDVAARAAAVMRPAPVVQDDWVRVLIVTKVADQFLLRRAAAQVFDGRVDEPDADVVPGARPTISGNLVLDGIVAVFVFDGVFVNALAHNPLLLRVDLDAGA